MKQKVSFVLLFFQRLSFLHTLFLENEAQTNKINYGTMFFMSTQVSLPKISLILQKMKKSAKKAIYALFAGSPSIVDHTALKQLCLFVDKNTKGIKKHQNTATG